MMSAIHDSVYPPPALSRRRPANRRTKHPPAALVQRRIIYKMSNTVFPYLTDMQAFTDNRQNYGLCARHDGNAVFYATD